MYNENEIELSESERALLAGLPREMPTGDLLEEKTVRALREAGHFGSSRRRPPSRLSLVLRIAAALALFAGGVATGRYILAGETQQSASTASPQTEIRQTQTAAPQNPVTQSPQESVVAEREMWM
jgi:hypothetical protein